MTPEQGNDPYPRMIIVLIVVTILLFLLVGAVLAYDFIARGHAPAASPPAAMDFDLRDTGGTTLVVAPSRSEP